MRFWAGILATSCLLVPLEGRAASRYAVIIGHNLGYADEEPLRFAERDAERVRDTLVEVGDIPANHTRLLLAPTVLQVESALRKMHERLMADPESSLLVYFGGHADNLNLHLSKEQLSRKKLIESVKKLPATLRIVILDACQTSRVGRSRGARAGPAFQIGILPASQHHGLVVMHSSRKGEPAQESDTLGGAVFTHYLVSALRGAADQDGDGQVSLLEAYSYAFQNTVRRSASGSEAVQHPSFELELAGSGDLVLSTPRRAKAALVIPPGSEDRYLVYQLPSGQMVAEVVSAPNSTLKLAVPAGGLLVQLRTRDRFLVTRVNIPYGGEQRIQAADFEEVPYELAARRGGGLILAPWRLLAEYHFRLDRLTGGYIPRHGPRVKLEWDLGELYLGAALGLGYAIYEHASNDGEEVDLYLAARLGWRTHLGPLELGVDAGPEAGLLYQERKRSDRERLEAAGVQVPANRYNLALSVGGGVEVHTRIPLGRDWSATVCLQTSLLARRIGDQNTATWRAIWVFGSGVGIATRW